MELWWRRPEIPELVSCRHARLGTWRHYSEGFARLKSCYFRCSPSIRTVTLCGAEGGNRKAMRPTATRLLHILVPVKRCDGTERRGYTLVAHRGTALLQMCRLCSQNPG